MRLEHLHGKEGDVFHGRNGLRLNVHRLDKCTVRRVVNGLPSKQCECMIKEPVIMAFLHPRPKPRTHLFQRGVGTPILKGL